METKELKISVPEGYVIDKENSTFECIKFKKIEQKRWRDNKEANIVGYYINLDSKIVQIEKDGDYKNIKSNHDVFAAEKQAKSALAMAQISQIMANDKRFGGVVTDEEWNSDDWKYIIDRKYNDVCINRCISSYYFMAFHTEIQRNLFLKENEDLIKDYLMLD